MPKYYNGSEQDLVMYEDHMGNDDAVCDAARVSMNKSADLFTVNQNERLINYLAKHNHWSPFAHCTIKMRFKAPIFIARQFVKHQVGFAWNEISRRYVNEEPSFWMPMDLRNKAENVKQGSSLIVHPASDLYKLDIDTLTDNATSLYNRMIQEGICPEQARMVLPQNMMTEWIWTGSLYAWSRMYQLRSDSHAQFEARIYAELVSKICSKYFPISWRALNETGQ
jgi:thymidylate synthase (FAD)